MSENDERRIDEENKTGITSRSLVNLKSKKSAPKEKESLIVEDLLSNKIRAVSESTQNKW